MSTYVIGDIHGRPHLLDQLIRDVPWDLKSDKIVFLGDLVDRGSDVPGVIDRVMKIASVNPRVVVLRGNHEQMLLDCLDYGDLQWLIPENGGLATLKGYGMDLAELQDVTDIHIPQEHIDFMRGLPFYHEDEQAIYVHAGLIPGEHPSDTDPDVLLWTRDMDFYKGYDGKLCFFGHTPTQYLPREKRQRKFSIYIHGSCVGMDTSGESDSPLSCMRVETFTLYQAHPSGRTEVDRLRALKPAPRDTGDDTA
ncbi:MAG TPA: metallophosphoesterase family protein [Blastocatellia bacterium]|nr:metallophosphoesterase family protein [Blastocatellia bacterium]